MLSIQYDSTFDGFLSVVFEIYKQRLSVADIQPDRRDCACNDLFTQPFRVETSPESARRLKRAIINAASEDVLALLNTAFRSEEDGVEMKMLAYLRKLFSGVEPNYGKNPASSEMLPLLKIAQSVRREAGDMRGMVRFNKLSDGTYFSEIEPKYDIVDFLTYHFKARFANERWAIYDSKRKYGVFYDGQCAVEMTIPCMETVTANTPPDVMASLWKDYYAAIAIKERENPKLMRQLLPARYWKHLTEKEKEDYKILKKTVLGDFSTKISEITSVAGEVLLPSNVAKANAARSLGIQVSRC